MSKNALELSIEAKKKLLEELKYYFSTELDQEIGDLKAELLYEFLEQHFGKAWYNKGIRDSSVFLKQKLEDLEVDMDQMYQ